MSLAITFALLAPLSVPAVQGQEPGVAPLGDTWEDVNAIWEETVRHWATEISERLAKGVDSTPAPSPAGDLWESFAALAAKGEPRAVVWLAQNVDQTGADDATRRARAVAIFEEVRAAGAAEWVAEASRRWCARGGPSTGMRSVPGSRG